MMITVDILHTEIVSPDRAIGMNLAHVEKKEEDKEEVIGTTEDVGTATAIETVLEIAPAVEKRLATIATVTSIGSIKVAPRLMTEIGTVDTIAIIEA